MVEYVSPCQRVADACCEGAMRGLKMRRFERWTTVAKSRIRPLNASFHNPDITPIIRPTKMLRANPSYSLWCMVLVHLVGCQSDQPMESGSSRSLNDASNTQRRRGEGTSTDAILMMAFLSRPRPSTITNRQGFFRLVLSSQGGADSKSQSHAVRLNFQRVDMVSPRWSFRPPRTQKLS